MDISEIAVLSAQIRSDLLMSNYHFYFVKKMYKIVVENNKGKIYCWRTGTIKPIEDVLTKEAFKLFLSAYCSVFNPVNRYICLKEERY